MPASVKSFTGGDFHFPNSREPLTFEAGSVRSPTHVSVYLPAAIESIDGSESFDSFLFGHPATCRPIYDIEPGNRHFAMVGCAVMNFAMTSAIPHFGRESANTPDSRVEDLGSRAFANRGMAFTFQDPAGLPVIAREVFLECDLLRALTVPSTVEAIGERAFAGCLELQEVGTATGSRLHLSEKLAFSRCYVPELIDVPSSAKVRRLFAVMAEVRDVDGSRRSPVRFETKALLPGHSHRRGPVCD